MKTTTQYVIVIRHGQTVPNLLLEQATDSYYYDVTGSDETIGLTNLGSVQIEQAAFFLTSYLRRLPRVQIAKIFCSQFFRTRSTAQIVQSILPNHPQIVDDKRIAKRHYGSFWNITYHGVKALFPEEYLKFTQQGGYFYRPPFGENYVDLKNRLTDFVRDEIDSTGDNICICTHSAAALMLEQLILGELTDGEVVKLYDSIAVPNGFVCIYERTRSTDFLSKICLRAITMFKHLFGLRRSSWKRMATYALSAFDADMERNNKEQMMTGDGNDSIVDKENRVA